jgi:type VI secretion system secreted protein VgrG
MAGSNTQEIDLGSPSFTQTNRPIRISTSLGADVLLLANFAGREAMSEPFEFKVQLYSQNRSIDANSVLRKPATVSIQISDTDSRYFNGVFRDFGQGGFDEKSGLYAYEGTIVPAIWFLSLGWNCKIFQNMSVPDIVEQTLKANGISAYKLSLTNSYSPRDYCVQYRESYLNFISRLLEEEGISYYFVHADGQHTLTIVDRTSSAAECIENQVSYSASSPEGVVADSSVWSLNRTDQVYTPKVALTDYNFETPSMNLLSSSQTINKTSGQEEKFDYPGGFGVQDEGTRYGNLRIEEFETFALVVKGDSNCASFTSGLQFTLADYYRQDTNQAYLLTSVHHEISAPNFVGGQGDDLSYQNHFEAIPLNVVLRPLRQTRKPLVVGSQTAVVVGPSGEEIYVDKYGRIKVQFFWDRDGQKNEKSSCWVRVSQVWAGKNWGWMTIPRIGQEVIVDFLEGDPDKPLIVGRIYNAEQMPPYTLPDNSTQSGIRSRSSKGGGTANYNEICFDDKMGSETLSIHAEKDMFTEVENDDSQSVEHDRTISVKGKHTETITGDTTITIKEGNHSLTLDQGNQATKISLGDQSTKVVMGSAAHEAMQQIELKVGQSSIVLTQEGITIKGLQISIQGTIQLEAKAAMTTVSADGILTVKGALTMIN